MCDSGVAVVAARLRPPPPKEASVVWATLQEPGVLVRLPGSPENEPLRVFPVDHIFSDADACGSQACVYRELGSGMLTRAATQGISSCLVAYGAKGTGKSHSILGYGNDPGLIPRATSELFKMVATVRPQLRVWCSYYEVRQERIRDLLRPSLLHENLSVSEESQLQICELPNAGVCIPTLTESAVRSIEEVQQLVDNGSRLRAATAGQLRTASQSHTVFLLNIEQPAPDSVSTVGTASISSAGTWRARLSFVDCASAEHRLHDLSLKALHHVVDGLKSDGKHVRDSRKLGGLCQFLTEPLAGHAQLIWLATLSPTLSCMSETFATLDLAKNVKQVVQRVQGTSISIVTREMLLQEIRQELHKLQASYAVTGSDPIVDSSALCLQRLTDVLNRPYETQLRDAETLRGAQEAVLNSYGLRRYEREANDSSDTSAYLVNISSDPMLSGCLLYKLPPAIETRIGAAPDNAILLRGLCVAQHHCSIRNGSSGVVELLNSDPARNRVLVNGKPVADAPHNLHDDDCILVGYAHAFRFISTARAERPLAEITLEDCLHNAEVHCPSAARAAAEPCLESVRQRFGADNCKRLTAQLQSLCPLVDEANELTRELRPNDNILFEVVACGAALDSADTLELSGIEVADLTAVRVLRNMGKDDSSGCTSTPNGLGHELPDLWTVEKFMDRLQAIRGLYDERCLFPNAATDPWVKDPLLDPWCDPSLSEIWRKAMKDPQNSASLLRWAGPWVEASIKSLEPKTSPAKDRLAATTLFEQCWSALAAVNVEMPLLSAKPTVATPAISTISLAAKVPGLSGLHGTDPRQSSCDTDCTLETHGSSRVLLTSSTSKGGTGFSHPDAESPQAIGDAVTALQKLIADVRKDQSFPEDPGGFELRATIIQRLEAQNAELHRDLARVEEQLKLRNNSLAKLTHGVTPAMKAGGVLQPEPNGSPFADKRCPASLASRTVVQAHERSRPTGGRLKCAKPPSTQAADEATLRRWTTPQRQIAPGAAAVGKAPEESFDGCKQMGSLPLPVGSQTRPPDANVQRAVSPQRLCVVARPVSPTIVARSSSPTIVARSPSPTIVARTAAWEAAGASPVMPSTSILGSPGKIVRALSPSNIRPASPGKIVRPVSPGRCGLCSQAIPGTPPGSLLLPRAVSESQLPGSAVAAPAAYTWPSGPGQMQKLSNETKSNRLTPMRLRTAAGSGCATPGQPPPRVQPGPGDSIRGQPPPRVQPTAGIAFQGSLRSVAGPALVATPVRGASPGPKRAGSPGPPRSGVRQQIRTFTPVRQRANGASTQRERSSSVRARAQAIDPRQKQREQPTATGTDGRVVHKPGESAIANDSSQDIRVNAMKKAVTESIQHATDKK